MGTPVGCHNRKAFLLFLAYSFALATLGAVMSWHELVYALPRRQLSLPLSTMMATLKVPASAMLKFTGAWFEDLVERSNALHGWIGVQYVWAVSSSALLNPIAAIALLSMTANQVGLVLRNRTTLDPDDARFDLGTWNNWRQVFGPDPWLWLVPVNSQASMTPDGYHWPTKKKAHLTSRTLHED